MLNLFKKSSNNNRFNFISIVSADKRYIKIEAEDTLYPNTNFISCLVYDIDDTVFFDSSKSYENNELFIKEMIGYINNRYPEFFNEKKNSEN